MLQEWLAALLEDVARVAFHLWRIIVDSNNFSENFLQTDLESWRKLFAALNKMEVGLSHP